MPRATVTSALGGSAVITLPATSNVAYGVFSIGASYNNVLITTGTLTVSVGGTVLYNIDLMDRSPFILNETFAGEANQAIVITLSGLLGFIGKLNVNYTANIV